MLDKLPIYKSKAWRAESNLLIRGQNALDIINFEEKELGNTEDFKYISKEIRKQLKSIPAKQIIWVCKRKKDCIKYGEPENIDIGTNPRILATDNEGGYLIIKGN